MQAEHSQATQQDLLTPASSSCPLKTHKQSHNLVYQMPQNTEICISISRTMPFQVTWEYTHECSSVQTAFHQEDPVVWQSRMEAQPAILLPAGQDLCMKDYSFSPRSWTLLGRAIKSKPLQSVCINNLLLQRVHAIVVLLLLLSCTLADILELFATCEVLKKKYSLKCWLLQSFSNISWKISSLSLHGKSESFPKTGW